MARKNTSEDKLVDNEAILKGTLSEFKREAENVSLSRMEELTITAFSSTRLRVVFLLLCRILSNLYDCVQLESRAKCFLFSFRRASGQEIIFMKVMHDFL